MAQAKGTQTERDAQNILEGITDNITDEAYLKERLPELRKKFERVMEERLGAVNMMRTQQGYDELAPEQQSRYLPPARKKQLPPTIAAPKNNDDDLINKYLD